ncbi:hypothetical protein, partial [Candidatus Sororendozoicomonas aggregata]|uniref:hypothetical protein n=1 Tax=Candidatus Sororendozoicomonas aggregata TaxID=3073239 RepID=UPI002ED2634B
NSPTIILRSRNFYPQFLVILATGAILGQAPSKGHCWLTTCELAGVGVLWFFGSLVHALVHVRVFTKAESLYFTPWQLRFFPFFPLFCLVSVLLAIFAAASVDLNCESGTFMQQTQRMAIS